MTPMRQSDFEFIRRIGKSPQRRVTIAVIISLLIQRAEFSITTGKHGMRQITAILVFLLATQSKAAQFEGITADAIAATYPYNLSDPIISVSTISGDGSTIGGSITQTGVIFDCAAFDCGTSAFVWSLNDSQRRPLGELAIGQVSNAYPKTVSALSFDGSIALATYEFRHYESGLVESGMATPLRNTISYGEWLWASDMSSDAETVVGSLGEVPFKWSKSTGFEVFAGIDPDSGYTPSAISGDGSTTILDDSIVGLNFVAADKEQRNSIRWTVSEGAIELEPVIGFHYSNATAVSHDGSIVVGNSVSNDGLTQRRATVWVGSEVSLLNTGFAMGSSSALDVSADGNTIVGTLDPTNPLTDAFFYPEAVIWRDGEFQLLEELLSDKYFLGEDLQGWNLTSATAISDDGTVIVGHGIDPHGKQAAWVANLAVPEPGSFFLSAMTILMLYGYRRKKIGSA